ncbi:MAG: hypothetical protein JRI47_08560 [Deltaproteobacteria bacterium]|nr:hypothetical protein [Deltaproteobacteria bacterium]
MFKFQLVSIVLIHVEEQPAFFARIEDITADSKPGWYQVRLLILQIPLTEVTWILRDRYIDGEPLTMDGRSVRLEKVERSETASASDQCEKKEENVAGNVVSIFDRKRG